MNVEIRLKPEVVGQDFICEPETGNIVAVIRGGEVFRDDREGAKIATALAPICTTLRAIWSVTCKVGT
jgi:hypothetical protein